jgi:hypothetical protein
MKVLSFAAVGFHGRECWTRAISRALVLAAAAATAAAARAQPAGVPQELLTDLAARIGGALPPAEPVHITAADDSVVRDTIVRLLRARGATIVDGPVATSVHVGCDRNLRERLCVAEIRNGSAVQVVSVARPLDAGAASADVPAPSLAVTTVLLRREPILDVAESGGRLIVLGREAIALYARANPSDDAGAPVSSAPILHARPLPRDTRGRLRVTASGFDALLPGVTCRGAIEPFAVSCSDESASWPIGIDNDGIAASRNTFATPEGLTFYGAAPLGPSRGGWLVAGRDGRLTFLDRLRSATARGPAADDVVAVEDGCAPGTYVVAASAAARGDERDELRLLRVDGESLTSIATVIAPGQVTALWAQPGGRAATAVVRRHSGPRYEALRLRLACAR